MSIYSNNIDVINVFEIVNGVISKIESFVILDNSEDKSLLIKQAENMFECYIRENYHFDEEENQEEIITNAIEEGYFTDNNGYEVQLVWSNVNT